MCMNCYAEAGAPRIVNEATLRAAKLVAELYATDYGGCGGNMHIVTDDWNLEDDNVAFCAACAAADGTLLEREIAAAFVAMTEDERASALALWDGFLLPDGTTDVTPIEPDEDE